MGQREKALTDSLCVDNLKVGDVVIFGTLNSVYTFGVIEINGGFTITIEQLEGIGNLRKKTRMTFFGHSFMRKGYGFSFFFWPDGTSLNVSAIQWLKVNGVQIF